MNGLVERKLTHTPEHFHFVSRKAWSRCARAWVITWWTQVTFYFHMTVTWHARNSTYYLPFSLFTISLRAKVNDGLQFFFSLLAKQVWNTWSFLSLSSNFKSLLMETQDIFSHKCHMTNDLSARIGWCHHRHRLKLSTDDPELGHNRQHRYKTVTHLH